MQARVEKAYCSSDTGKLPQTSLLTKLDSFINNLCLKYVIPVDHLEYWKKFVLVCIAQKFSAICLTQNSC